MRNKFGEPKAGCSMLIGCGSLVIIILVIYMIISMAALSGYMSEIYARSQGDQEQYLAYLQGLVDNVANEMSALNLDYLQILMNAAQIVTLFLIFKLIYKRPLSQMGLSAQHWFKRLNAGCLTGIIGISLYALIASVSGLAVFTGFDLQNLLSVDMLTSLIFFISIGFYEEILNRGFFMTILKTTRRKIMIIALPAVIFGCMHILNPNITLLGLINIILIGLAFAFMFIKTGSLWMPIGFHITWNFFQGNIFGIQVSGLEQASVMAYSAIGPDILTGGDFGAEGGLICTVITLGLLAYLYFGFNVDEPPVWTLDSDLPFNNPPASVGN